MFFPVAHNFIDFPLTIWYDMLKGGINLAPIQNIAEYECPCCGAALKFSGAEQKLSCEYCDNTFELDTVKEYNTAAQEAIPDEFVWDDNTQVQWDPDTQANRFSCPSCGGEILTDATTAATFCPYCDNPAILTGQVSGELRPDGVIPFKTTKEDAKKAFLKLCKGKYLLPKGYTSEQRLEKITGVYVPFWLYDCSGNVHGKYKATQVSRWSDSKYHYTKTDHYMLTRGAQAGFSAIPMDGSSKMDNAIMESIEPFDTTKSVDFDTAYLSGFLADKYDVEAKQGEDRIRQRVDATLEELLAPSFAGFSSVIPTQKNLQVNHNHAKYLLLPVWMLCSKYQGKTYMFAMNGQTGKITGTLPIDKKKKWRLFSTIVAGCTLLGTLVGLLAIL